MCLGVGGGGVPVWQLTTLGGWHPTLGRHGVVRGMLRPRANLTFKSRSRLGGGVGGGHWAKGALAIGPGTAGVVEGWGTHTPRNDRRVMLTTLMRCFLRRLCRLVNL